MAKSKPQPSPSLLLLLKLSGMKGIEMAKIFGLPQPTLSVLLRAAEETPSHALSPEILAIREALDTALQKAQAEYAAARAEYDKARAEYEEDRRKANAEIDRMFGAAS